MARFASKFSRKYNENQKLFYEKVIKKEKQKHLSRKPRPDQEIMYGIYIHKGQDNKEDLINCVKSLEKDLENYARMNNEHEQNGSEVRMYAYNTTINLVLDGVMKE